MDYPNTPELSAADNMSSIKVSWTDSDTGVYGGYVDTQAVSHKFYNLKETAQGIVPELEAEIPAGTNSYNTAINTDKGEQTLKQYGVSAVNEVGEGMIAVTPSVVVGRPYAIPFFESVPNGEPTYGMWWLGTRNSP